MTKKVIYFLFSLQDSSRYQLSFFILYGIHKRHPNVNIHHCYQHDPYNCCHFRTPPPPPHPWSATQINHHKTPTGGGDAKDHDKG